MELALIDAIGPFFRDLHQRRINWSKIPFAHIATEGLESDAQRLRIQSEIEMLAVLNDLDGSLLRGCSGGRNRSAEIV